MHHKLREEVEMKANEQKIDRAEREPSRDERKLAPETRDAQQRHAEEEPVQQHLEKPRRRRSSSSNR